MHRSEAMEQHSYLELRLHKAAQEIPVHGLRRFLAGVEEVQDVDWGVIDMALSNGWRCFWDVASSSHYSIVLYPRA